MTGQPISTEGVTVHETGSMTFDGREAVNLYAFTMLRQSVITRIKTDGRLSLLRRQEATMAFNYGWSERKRFSPALLDDLNAVAREYGIPEKGL